MRAFEGIATQFCGLRFKRAGAGWHALVRARFGAASGRERLLLDQARPPRQLLLLAQTVVGPRLLFTVPLAFVSIPMRPVSTRDSPAAIPISTDPVLVSLPYLPMAKRKALATRPLAPALAAALEENKDVKVRVESAAIDLAAAGAVLKEKIADGDPEQAAQVALEVSKEVETKVAECADDLHAVNVTLAHGVADLEHTESELATARAALASTRSALAAAKEGERKAQFAALHDLATGMPNRQHFDSRLTHDMAVADRRGFGLAVMFLDLNKFKEINDALGHAAGDEVLRQVAARLLEHCRSEDTVCRAGGDEFLYLLIEPKGRENVQRIASTLVEALALPMHLEGRQIMVRPSVGISLYPEHGSSATELIANADAAMYRAKTSDGGPGWAFYDAALSSHTS